MVIIPHQSDLVRANKHRPRGRIRERRTPQGRKSFVSMFNFGTKSGHGKAHAIGSNVYIALLTALLLLSPPAARAVAQVLTQNGVALPAHVVRVLDALPLDAKNDEAIAETNAASETTHEPAPEAVAVAVVPVSAPTVPVFAPAPLPRFVATNVILPSRVPGRRSPRAPPV